VKKAVENLPQRREKMSAITDNYLDVQQDILETFLDRGQLRQFAEPTVLANGRRIPGLKLDHPRLLAVMHAVVRFAHIAAGNTFSTTEIHPHAVDALGSRRTSMASAHCAMTCPDCGPRSLRSQLPHSRRYRITTEGYSVCLVFLQLFERIYAPLTAGL
jgi:hypothetical protein